MEEREAEKQAEDVKNAARAVASAAVSFASGNWVGGVITLIANLGSVFKLLLVAAALVALLVVYLIMMPVTLILDSTEAITDEGAYMASYEKVRENTAEIIRDGFDGYYGTAYAKGKEVKDSYGGAGESIEIIVTPSRDDITLSRDAANGMMATYHVIQYHNSTDVNDQAAYSDRYYSKVRQAVSVTSGQYSFFTCTVTENITSREVPVEDGSSGQQAAVSSAGRGALRRPADDRGNPEDGTEETTVQQTETLYEGTVVVNISVRPNSFMRDELDAMLIAEGGTRTGTGTGTGSWPLPLEYDESYITSGYGYRDLGIGLGEEFHDGIDFGVPEGTEVYAIMDGTVFQVNHMDANTYPDGERSTGNCVYLKHDGNIYSVYMHLSSTAGLSPGDTVSKGQVIGLVGNTGFSSGPHLDLTVRVGGVGGECCVNPMDYISYGNAETVRDSRNYLGVMAAVVSEGGHGYSNTPGGNLGPDYDCGSFVSYALFRTGILNEMCAYEPNGETGTSPSSLGLMLMAHGFTQMEYSGMENLMPGDILVTDGHCETYYGNGKLIGAHNSRDGISITPFFEQDWIHVYRLEGVNFSTGGSSAVTTGILAQIEDVRKNLALEFGASAYTAADQRKIAREWAAATESQYSRSSVITQLRAAGFSETQTVIIMGWMQGEADYSDDPYLGWCSANAIMNQVKNGLGFGSDGMLWGQPHYLYSAMYDRAFRSEWLTSSGKGIYLALQHPKEGITQCWGIYSAGVTREECFYVSDTVLSEGEPTGVW